MFLAKSSLRGRRPLAKTLKLAVWAFSLIFLLDSTLFVIDIHQNMPISQFSTPFDHFQILPTLAVNPNLILEPCHIFCKDMILATCQCQHIFCCWVEPSLLLSSSYNVFMFPVWKLSGRFENCPDSFKTVLSGREKCLRLEKKLRGNHCHLKIFRFLGLCGSTNTPISTFVVLSFSAYSS